MTGQTQKRREDKRFVTGSGSYTSDLQPEGLLHLVFVRSSHAHARIVNIDIARAAVANGVVTVVTAADLAAAGLRSISGGFREPRHDGQPAPKTDRPPLAEDRVRCLGEAVVAVVAKTLAEAIAASELVDIDYESFPVVTGVESLQAGAPPVWDTAPDNVAFFWEGGNSSATEAALRRATHVTRLKMRVSRVTANPMETRNALARPSEDGRLIVHASHQSPHTLRDGLEAAGFEKGSISVRIGDVGGSFGLKTIMFSEAIVVAYAARRLKRAVLWESTRIEAFQSDDHAREMQAEAEIGFTARKRIAGLKLQVRGNVGAYVSGISGWIINNIGGAAGVYDIPAIHAEAYGYFSNTSPTAAYRGAGRPEATYLIERLLDVAAQELGVSPFELRRRNLIPVSAMPYRTALTYTYDCGEFEANMDAAHAMANLSDFPARRKKAAQRGRLRGIGICNCIEPAGGPYHRPQPDIARVSLLTNGRVRIQSGSMSVGQGHETVFPQLVADRFGISVDRVDYEMGNTDILPFGRGNGSSSAACVGASAIAQATTTLISRLSNLAAGLLSVPQDSIFLAEGIFRSREANNTLTLTEVAAQAERLSDQVAVEEVSKYQPADVTYPNGTHICEVEIDPETGMVEIVGYSAVEDIGRVLHPVLAEGQIQGGIAQGIGQALGENLVYDPTGQLLTASFMDYQMPRASNFPKFRLGFREVPTKTNDLGVKGVGEAGTVGALSATMNAINDALATLGIRHIDMPATPVRVWEAINASTRSKTLHARKSMIF